MFKTRGENFEHLYQLAATLTHHMLCSRRPNPSTTDPQNPVHLCPLSQNSHLARRSWGRALVFAILPGMGILIGMDEAGYGPNLGPLVVAATAWEIADDGPASGVQGSHEGEPASAGGRPAGATATAVRRTKHQSQHDHIDLYRALRNIVAKSASERRVPIADSKVLYNPAAGLRHLERGLHAVLLAMRQQLSCWSEIVHYCQADPDGHHRRACWPDEFDCSLPIHAAANELTRLGARFARACQSASVRPLVIRARFVFPEQFNDLVAYYNSKGAALSHVTVGLLREVMNEVAQQEVADCAIPNRAATAQNGSPTRQIGHTRGKSGASPPTPDLRPPTSITAVCDKHGGRNYYTALLQHHFSEHWITPAVESHAESRYEWGPDEARVRITFRVNGEAFLPTALASMTAKYLRELAMKAFNDFWCARVPDLRPTAGYYGDSRRFKEAIAEAQSKLKIDDHVLWRNR